MSASSLYSDRTEDRIAALVRSSQSKPHGTRARYVGAKCRCDECRQANTQYRRKRDAEIKVAPKDVLVSSRTALNHIKRLAVLGIGYKTVADASGVSKSVIQRILWGPRTNVRRSTRDAILGVDGTCLPETALVPAQPTWNILNRLIDDGYTKAQIARWLGHKVPALQFKRDRITARNASKVERMAKMIKEGRLRRDR